MEARGKCFPFPVGMPGCDLGVLCMPGRAYVRMGPELAKKTLVLSPEALVRVPLPWILH